MDLSDCVPPEYCLPGYRQVPEVRIQAQRRVFAPATVSGVMEWLGGFIDQGHTKARAWVCYSTASPHPAVEAFIVTEAPCT